MRLKMISLAALLLLFASCNNPQATDKPVSNEVSNSADTADNKEVKKKNILFFQVMFFVILHFNQFLF